MSTSTMYPGGTVTVRSGTRFSQGLAIDPLLDDADAAADLYAKWNDAWGEPLEVQGGVKIVTCEMVLAVPFLDLVSVYGKRKANLFVEVATRHTTL